MNGANIKQVCAFPTIDRIEVKIRQLHPELPSPPASRM